MKRTALLIGCCVLLYGVQDAATADFNIHTGGRTQTRGTVDFKLNGGAGRRPQFEIGGEGRFNRTRARRVEANSFPVAVAPYGGGYGYGYGYGGGYFGMGGFSNLYTQGFIPVPPYYSLHPPVYYSVPVPRTYGYSPFPYPGSVPTPDVVISEPEIIDNPHMAPEEAPAPAEEASTKTAFAAPQVIRNPFVEQSPNVTLTAQSVD